MPFRPIKCAPDTSYLAMCSRLNGKAAQQALEQHQPRALRSGRTVPAALEIVGVRSAVLVS